MMLVFNKLYQIYFFLIGLTIVFPCPGAQAQVSLGPDDLPEWSLGAQAGGGPSPPLSLAAARNEYLIVPFRVQGDQLDDLSLELTSPEAAPGLAYKAYLLRPVPHHLPSGFLVDGLVPLKTPLGQPGHSTQTSPRIVVVIHIPASHPPGTYSYQVHCRTRVGQHLQPLNMRVWGFTLPQDLPIAIMANFRPVREWLARYGAASAADFDRVVKAYLGSLREYKINAIAGFYPLPLEKLAQGASLSDFPEFTRMLDVAVTDLQYRFFRLPAAAGAKERGPNLQAYMTHYFPEVQRYLKAKGWEGRALVKLWDEPKRDVFPQVLQVYRQFKAAFPRWRTECTGWPPSLDLARVVDVWSVFAGVYDPNAIKAARQQGQEIWLYANQLHGSDRLPAHQRLIGYQLYHYGFSGYYLWGVNVWREDPWTTPPTKSESFRRGTFYYPHPHTGMPLPTLRLEALRRGFQDYQYLTLLAAAAQQGRIDAATFNHMQQKVASLTADLTNPNPSVNWGTMEQIRLELGELLEKASGGAG